MLRLVLIFFPVTRVRYQITVSKNSAYDQSFLLHFSKTSDFYVGMAGTWHSRTCKLGHVWLKIKFCQVFSCVNLIIIWTNFSLKFPPVVVYASIIQQKWAIFIENMSKDLSVNSMCTLQGCVVFGNFLSHKISENWQQKFVQTNPDHNPSLLVLTKVKTGDWKVKEKRSQNCQKTLPDVNQQYQQTGLIKLSMIRTVLSGQGLLVRGRLCRYQNCPVPHWIMKLEIK